MRLCEYILTANFRLENKKRKLLMEKVICVIGLQEKLIVDYNRWRHAMFQSLKLLFLGGSRPPDPLETYPLQGGLGHQG